MGCGWITESLGKRGIMRMGIYGDLTIWWKSGHKADQYLVENNITDN